MLRAKSFGHNILLQLIWNKISFHLILVIVIVKTTGVINTVRGYHATSCCLVLFVVNYFLFGTGRQTQFCSLTNERACSLSSAIANPKLHVLPLVQTQSDLQSGRLGDRLAFT